MSEPIENHGVIGDLETAALVAMDGSIDFMCFPHFDSPTIFADLLDPGKGGFFRICPTAGDFKRRQRYYPNTNILLTRFLSPEGVMELSDHMPIQHLGHRHALVRRLKAVRGDIRMRMTCAPRFDYGRAGHTVERLGKCLVFRSRGPDKSVLRLRSSVPFRVRGGDAEANFVLRSGQIASFVLEDGRDRGDSPAEGPDYVSESFKETMNFWLAWIGRSLYRGRWREIVDRSALTLKLMTSLPLGSMVAAPTFGLPELAGGKRNWDYRYTWIRDASFTLEALMSLGYRDEAVSFMNWMEQRVRGGGPKSGRRLQVLYTLDGRREVPETILKMRGYEDSRPVRIGNAACGQLQLDIYGELLDAVYRFDRENEPLAFDFWKHLAGAVDWVSENWHRPDDGIWEVRGGAKPFCNSRVACWVALDRGLRLASRHSFPAPIEKWRRARDRIYREVYEKFWNPRLKAFTQYRGAETVDASSLRMPIVGFVGAKDPRWLSTMKAIERSLVEDSLVYRYLLPSKAAPDGFTGREGTFSVCSFWYVECLARSGDIMQARYIFEKALGYANHLGLYAEQLGPSGEHLGNFPQALPHIALINAAVMLNARLDSGEGEPS
ncbi:MAG TPA: glycoside hydrolase family 15 protein [Elusimicrobiota bacterium]|nr:glycoside hydrolase family 15 protein [Elusimicrobiota bacterium]